MHMYKRKLCVAASASVWKILVICFSCSFGINLQNDEYNEHMHMGLRVSEQAFVRNTKSGGGWGAEERTIPYWPFTVNQEFKMKVCAEGTNFRVK